MAVSGLGWFDPMFLKLGWAWICLILPRPWSPLDQVGYAANYNNLLAGPEMMPVHGWATNTLMSLSECVDRPSYNGGILVHVHIVGPGVGPG